MTKTLSAAKPKRVIKGTGKDFGKSTAVAATTTTVVAATAAVADATAAAPADTDKLAQFLYKYAVYTS